MVSYSLLVGGFTLPFESDLYLDYDYYGCCKSFNGKVKPRAITKSLPAVTEVTLLPSKASTLYGVYLELQSPKPN
jgi:hypothetical protein